MARRGLAVLSANRAPNADRLWQSKWPESELLSTVQSMVCEKLTARYAD